MPKQDPENVLTTTEKTKARPPSYLEDDTQGLDLLDPIEEKKLVRKLDRHIIPIAMLLYLLSFLDRVNIGNAKLYGLEEDLGLTGNQYQIATSVLFVSYVIFEVPSNLVLKRFKPSRYIASIVALWGLVATLTGLTKNFGELVACRLLLGLFEAGLFPGLAMYLTFFYTKRELALRIGYLFVSAALAGACGGLLAYGIGHMDGVAGQRGWRWIMIFEGIPTFLMGIVTWFVLADDPEHARYLSPREKAMVIARREKQAGHTTSAEELHWKDAKKGFTDWKVLAFGVAQVSHN
ncbi:MAG: hypothetical protein M1816_003855 [Peltula sp. TS41687]|nr:MAG: hypothetical protein M1816_003855 [Peltula sp. TS41687]